LAVRHHWSWDLCRFRRNSLIRFQEYWLNTIN
jgi:hypothetical protein